MSSLLLDPALRDCRRLFLRNYEVWINIGVHDFEKKGEQRVLINVDLFVPLAQTTPHNDQLDEVVDYDFIRRSIGERVAREARSVARLRGRFVARVLDLARAALKLAEIDLAATEIRAPINGVVGAPLPLTSMQFAADGSSVLSPNAPVPFDVPASTNAAGAVSLLVYVKLCVVRAASPETKAEAARLLVPRAPRPASPPSPAASTPRRSIRRMRRSRPACAQAR